MPVTAAWYIESWPIESTKWCWTWSATSSNSSAPVPPTCTRCNGPVDPRSPFSRNHPPQMTAALNVPATMTARDRTLHLRYLSDRRPHAIGDFVLTSARIDPDDAAAFGMLPLPGLGEKHTECAGHAFIEINPRTLDSIPFPRPGARVFGRKRQHDREIRDPPESRECVDAAHVLFRQTPAGDLIGVRREKKPVQHDGPTR